MNDEIEIVENLEERLDDSIEFEKRKFFDIRTNGFYEKLGGITEFLQIVSKLKDDGVNILVYGTMIESCDLRLILTEFNYRNDDRQLGYEEGEIVWTKAPEKIVKQDFPKTHLGTDITAFVAGCEQEEPIEDEKSILERYISAVNDSRYDINNITLANKLLRDMIEKRVNDFTHESLKSFVINTRKFVETYTHELLFDTLESVFDYLAQIKENKFDTGIISYMNDILMSGTAKLCNYSKTTDDKSAKILRGRLKDINKKAFEAFIRLGDISGNINYIRASAYHMLKSLDRLVLNQEVKDYEKMKLIDEGLEVCKRLVDKDTPKDARTYVNADFYVSLLNFYAFKITGEDKYYQIANRYFMKTQSSLKNVRSRRFAEGVHRQLSELERRMLNGNNR
ncbi:hypothetical protein KY330_04260 [Candidatus Woesearchaeota archaeon]|nr:hypothetical protein [Candidatus Woesearchaeota archaeon]